MTPSLRRHRRYGVGKGLRRPFARRLRITFAVAVVVLGSALLAQGAAAQVWTTNLVMLDDGTCGRNLQIGSDRTASGSSTPTFRLMGDGPLSSYAVFINGVPHGVFYANGYSNVCINITTPLPDGAYVLTADELTPRPTMTVSPFPFSVDTVAPPMPSVPVLSGYSDSGIIGDRITKYRNANFTGTAEAGSNVQIYSSLAGAGGAKADANGNWSATTSPLGIGTQTVKAASSDLAGNPSPHSAGVTVTVDITPPATPAAPVLDPASDTAPLGDNATTVANPVVTGTAGADVWKVYVFRNGTQVGTVFPGAGGAWQFTLPTTAQGTHQIAVMTNDSADNLTGYSPNLSLTIGAAPTTTVPGAPTLDSATAGSGSVTLAWTPPASNGGSTITGYKVYRGTTSGGATLLTTVGSVTGFVDNAVTGGTTYYYQVSAVNGVGEGARSGERSATPSAPATAPGAPTLATLTPGNARVTLGWVAPLFDGGAAITGYRVYRGTSSGSLSLLTTLGTGTGWTDTTAANGTTWYYQVSAVNSVGEGARSNEGSATPMTQPGAPNLTSATAGSGSVTLGWSAPASNGGSPITGYRVYRGTTQLNGTLVATLGNVTGWLDTGVSNGTTYYYNVAAVNVLGEGVQSNQRSATPTQAATVPGAPTLNSATAGNGSVTLGWSAPASNGGSAITGYKVYRGTSSGSGSLVATLGVVAGWTDTAAANGTTFFYRVSAVNGVGEGAQSNERSATPSAPATVPGAPTLNSATAGNGSVTLGWSAPASNGGSAVTGYKVYRGTSSGSGSLVATLGLVAGWTDTAAANGTTFFYRVSAVNGVGEGAQSNERSATPVAPTSVPGAPTLTTVNAGNAFVALSWTPPLFDGGAAVTSYRVFRGTSSGNLSLLNTLGNVTGWTDTTAANGTTWYYQVSAVNSAGEGARSNEGSATPMTVPGAPTFASATPGNGTVALAWNAPAVTGGSPVTGYKVYRGTSSGSGSLVATLGVVGGWTDTAAANGTTWYYRVSAVNLVGEGPRSNELSATPTPAATVPGAPTLDSATPASQSVTIEWTPGSNGGAPITGYWIYRSTTAGGAGSLIGSVGVTTAYTDIFVSNGTTYYYRVAAANSVGVGPKSNELGATPATVPGAPSLSSATGGSGTVTLWWMAPMTTGGSPVTGYKVYRGTTSGTGSVVATLGAVTNWVDTAVSGGTTYYYRVTALNAMGEGAQSNERSAAPTAAASVPGAPTLDAATGGNGNVMLGWTQPASAGGSAITGYRVYRGTTSGGGTLLATVGLVTSWADTAAANGTTYYYRVSAVNAMGEGAQSNERSATPAAPATAPSAPTLETATAGSANVALTWSAPASNGGSAITGYRVYRGTTSGGGTLLATLGAVSGWTDTTAANGTTYFYRVSAVNAVGEGAQSNERSATPTASPTVPGAPTLNSATPGSGSVTLAWSPPASNGGATVTGYRVYRGTTSGSGSLVATLGAVVGWTDTAAANGTTYFYRVSAVNAVGEGAQSNERSAIPTAAPTAPGAPTLDSASPAPGSVTLAWSAPASNGGATITGYRIYRGTSSGGETFLTTVGAVTGWTDSSVVAGTTYFYQVSAVNSVGEGPRSNERTATTLASGDTSAPSQPGSSKILAVGTTQMVLDWTGSTDNVGVAGYQVLRGGVVVATVTTTWFLDSGLTPGVTYAYTVRAVDAAGNLSAASSSVSGKALSVGTSSNGILSGIVFSPAGAPISSAISTVTVNGSVKSTKTNRSGLWKHSTVPPGTYTVTISLTGYRTQTVSIASVAGRTALSAIQLEAN